MHTPPFVRSLYNFDQEKNSDNTGTFFDHEKEPSLAQQHLEKETNINNIIARFAATGEMPQASAPVVDLTGLPQDYREAIELMRAGEESLSSLPQHIQDLAQGDPYKLIRLIATATNDELARLGVKQWTQPRDLNSSGTPSEKPADSPSSPSQNQNSETTPSK